MPLHAQAVWRLPVKAAKISSRPCSMVSLLKGQLQIFPAANRIARSRTFMQLSKILSSSTPICSMNPSCGASCALLLIRGSHRPDEHRPNPSAKPSVFHGPRPHGPEPFSGFCMPPSSSSELCSWTTSTGGWCIGISSSCICSPGSLGLLLFLDGNSSHPFSQAIVILGLAAGRATSPCKARPLSASDGRL